MAAFMLVGLVASLAMLMGLSSDEGLAMSSELAEDYQPMGNVFDDDVDKATLANAASKLIHGGSEAAAEAAHWGYQHMSQLGTQMKSGVENLVQRQFHQQN